jgi:hypothetical protein
MPVEPMTRRRSEMSIRDFERSVIAEVKQITGRRKLRLKDLLEWNTVENVVKANLVRGEMMIHCPEMGVWAAIPKPKEPTNDEERK